MTQRRDFLFMMAAACLSPAAVTFAHARSPLLDNPRAENLIKRLHDEHNFSQDWLRRVFAGLSYEDQALRLIGATPPDDSAPPPAPVYWRDYRRRRVTPKKIAEGVMFYNEHKAALQKTETAYGVPAEFIVAIIGIETNYGRITGNYPVAGALATMVLGHPRRSEEFYEELAAFLQYAQNNRIDPRRITGSYAGAIGIPQFMPSSMQKYAVDLNGNASVNLFKPADAISSIGNFLKAHGWRGNIGVSAAADIDKAQAQALIEATERNAFKPLMTKEELTAYGARTTAPEGVNYLFVDLQNRYDREYRVGTENFYAITRYNKSFKYAAVVTDLAVEIRRQTGEAASPAPHNRVWFRF